LGELALSQPLPAGPCATVMLLHIAVIHTNVASTTVTRWQPTPALLREKHESFLQMSSNMLSYQ
jgi:hypothetical protein